MTTYRTHEWLVLNTECNLRHMANANDWVKKHYRHRSSSHIFRYMDEEILQHDNWVRRIRCEAVNTLGS